jgi:Tfp pilus assembly protein PilW
MVALVYTPGGRPAQMIAMESLKQRMRALRRDEGVTLVELLLVAVLGVLVLGIGVMLLILAVRAEPRLSERAASIQQGRALMERLTREVRQGATVSVATPERLVFATFVKRASCGGPTAATAIQCQVEYSCTSGACSRTERNTNGTGGGAPVQLVEGLLSSSVFTYTPSATSPEYVRVRLAYPATDEQGETEDAVTLEDGVNLRNFPLE